MCFTFFRWQLVFRFCLSFLRIFVPSRWETFFFRFENNYFFLFSHCFFFSFFFDQFSLSNHLPFNIVQKKIAFSSDVIAIRTILHWIVSHWKAIFAILAPLIFGTKIKTLTICHDFYEKTLVAQSNRRFFSSSVRKLQLIKLECLALSIFFFVISTKQKIFLFACSITDSCQTVDKNTKWFIEMTRKIRWKILKN